MGVCNCSMFCCTLLCVYSSIAIILIGKRELVALLCLSSWCLVVVGRLSSRCRGVVCSDIIRRELQAENNIQLKYTSMEEPTEFNRQDDNNFVFYHGTGEQDVTNQID